LQNWPLFLWHSVCRVRVCRTMRRHMGLCRYNWRPSLGIGLPCCFYSKTGFWPSYCHISTDLDKILHTPVVVRNTLVGRLRPRSAHGRLQAKPKLLFFVILVTHHNSYTDSRDSAQTVMSIEVRTGAIVKNS